MEQLPPNEQEPLIPEILPGMPGNDVEENKDMAALSYAWVLSLVIFFTRGKSPFVRFHAKQGIVLFILSIVFWMIPFVGRLLELVVLAFCALGFIAAAQGQWKELPFVGAIAKGDWKALRHSWRSFVNSVADAWRKFRKEPTAPQNVPNDMADGNSSAATPTETAPTSSATPTDTTLPPSPPTP